MMKTALGEVCFHWIFKPFTGDFFFMLNLTRVQNPVFAANVFVFSFIFHTYIFVYYYCDFS